MADVRRYARRHFFGVQATLVERFARERTDCGDSSGCNCSLCFLGLRRTRSTNQAHVRGLLSLRQLNQLLSKSVELRTCVLCPLWVFSESSVLLLRSQCHFLLHHVAISMCEQLAAVASANVLWSTFKMKRVPHTFSPEYLFVWVYAYF